MNNIVIDDKLYEEIISNQRFRIKPYDRFIYLLLVIISLALLIVSTNVLSGDYKKINTINLVSKIILVAFVVCVITIAFYRAFHFQKIVTAVSSNEALLKIEEVFKRNKIFFVTTNYPNVIVCFEPHRYLRSIIETTIIIENNFLLINCRLRNTAFISIGQSIAKIKCIQTFDKYRKDARNLILEN